MQKTKLTACVLGRDRRCSVCSWSDRDRDRTCNVSAKSITRGKHRQENNTQTHHIHRHRCLQDAHRLSRSSHLSSTEAGGAASFSTAVTLVTQLQHKHTSTETAGGTTQKHKAASSTFTKDECGTRTFSTLSVNLGGSTTGTSQGGGLIPY